MPQLPKYRFGVKGPNGSFNITYVFDPSGYYIGEMPTLKREPQTVGRTMRKACAGQFGP
jgi:hypothetical protein